MKDNIHKMVTKGVFISQTWCLFVMTQIVSIVMDDNDGNDETYDGGDYGKKC